jgi:hypothetical protein
MMRYQSLVPRWQTVAGLWLAWEVADEFLSAPRWAWLTAAGGLGVGAEFLLGNGSSWWLGLGTGGTVALLVLLSDWALVATDASKVAVLRQTGRR